MTAGATDPSVSLCDCEQWMTMLALTPPAVQRLDNLVRQTYGREAGEGGSRREVIAGLILHAPENADSLGSLSVELRSPKYSGFQQPVSRLNELVRNNVVVQLPAPVSLRLDRLVARARDAGYRAHRTNLVVGLIFLADKYKPSTICRLASGTRTCPARSAALQSEPASTVLSLDRPKPGPREK